MVTALWASRQQRRLRLWGLLSLVHVDEMQGPVCVFSDGDEDGDGGDDNLHDHESR